MTRTLPITQVRQQLPTLVAKAAKQLDEFIITVNGTPAAILMSLAEYESWRETAEILADPKAIADLKASEEDIKHGRVYDWEDVKKELGLDVQTPTHR